MELAGIAVATAIFILTYVAIFTGRVHHALAALIGGVAMALAGIAFGFYTEKTLIAQIDFDTLWLLFGMMAIVGLLRATGFFQYVAIWVTKQARGNPWVLLVSLSVLTAGTSMLLDNVTTMLTVAPVTFSVAEILAFPAAPFILIEALAANIGGTATLVGDPPNILIGSAAAFSFNDFLSHTAPVALVALVALLGVAILQLRGKLRRGPQNVEALAAMDARKALIDRRTMRKLVIVVALVFLLFLVHQVLGITPGMIALIGAAIAALVLRPKMEDFLKGVEWDLLIFLMGLFVIMGGLERSGALPVVARGLVGLAGGNLIALALLLLWVGALLSWTMSAIPVTVTLISLVRGLEGLGIPQTPLWWALALGIGLGANGTPLGSASNMVVITVASRTKGPLSFRAWARVGVPVAIFTCAIASLALWIGIRSGWFL
ncbi:MAG: ArsB/NhaD family transporter [Candidatus Acetothermia bacterium]|nr:ArsB/NhaD family transporter [Candidatus Acetothermia bacterium]